MDDCFRKPQTERAKKGLADKKINKQVIECWNCGEMVHSKNECNKPKAQEGQGGGVVGAKTAGALDAISSRALASVVNGRSKVEGGCC